MWGTKKKDNIKTFIDGQQEGDIPVPKPADAPVLGPSQAPAQEPPHQPAVRTYECEVCRDYGWYCDNMGVCHNCPRCNPKSLKEVKDAVSSVEELDRPKSNLNLLRVCKECGHKNEIHRMKKKFKCSECGLDQEVRA